MKNAITFLGVSLRRINRQTLDESQTARSAAGKVPIHKHWCGNVLMSSNARKILRMGNPSQNSLQAYHRLGKSWPKSKRKIANCAIMQVLSNLMIFFSRLIAVPYLGFADIPSQTLAIFDSLTLFRAAKINHKRKSVSAGFTQRKHSIKR